MGQLVKFELKKIFSRRLVWIGILLVVLVNVSGFLSLNTADVKYEQELAKKYEGVLDDAKVQQMLADFKPTEEQLQMWGGLSVAYVGTSAMQSAVHSHFANEDGTWNGKTVTDVFGDEEIQVGYNDGWLNLSSILIRVALGMALLAVVMTAPVFAGEYEGVDNIILTSRFGRSKCVFAKIIAAFAGPVMTAAVLAAGNCAAALAVFGTEGLDAGVLFCSLSYHNYIPFNISCGTMLLYQAGLIFSGIIMTVGITLFISAVCKNQVTALIASAVVFMFPLLFSVMEKQPLFKLIGLMPVYHVQFSSLMSVAQLQGKFLFAVWAFPAALSVCIAGCLLGKRFFTSHEVS